MPIYHVKTPTSEHIVDAATQQGAISHIARGTITAKSLTAADTVYLMQRGLPVEKAKAEAAIPAAAETTQDQKNDA